MFLSSDIGVILVFVATIMGIFGVMVASWIRRSKGRKHTEEKLIASMGNAATTCTVTAEESTGYFPSLFDSSHQGSQQQMLKCGFSMPSVVEQGKGIWATKVGTGAGGGKRRLEVYDEIILVRHGERGDQAGQGTPGSTSVKLALSSLVTSKEQQKRPHSTAHEDFYAHVRRCMLMPVTGGTMEMKDGAPETIGPDASSSPSPAVTGTNSFAFYQDPPLSTFGHTQAARYAEHWTKGARRSMPVTMVVASPFLRCVQTALPVAESLGVPLVLHPYLGDWMCFPMYPMRVLAPPRPALAGSTATTAPTSTSVMAMAKASIPHVQWYPRVLRDVLWWAYAMKLRSTASHASPTTLLPSFTYPSIAPTSALANTAVASSGESEKIFVERVLMGVSGTINDLVQRSQLFAPQASHVQQQKSVQIALTKLTSEAKPTSSHHRSGTSSSRGGGNADPSNVPVGVRVILCTHTDVIAQVLNATSELSRLTRTPNVSMGESMLSKVCKSVASHTVFRDKNISVPYASQTVLRRLRWVELVDAPAAAGGQAPVVSSMGCSDWFLPEHCKVGDVEPLGDAVMVLRFQR